METEPPGQEPTKSQVVREVELSRARLIQMQQESLALWHQATQVMQVVKKVSSALHPQVNHAPRATHASHRPQIYLSAAMAAGLLAGAAWWWHGHQSGKDDFSTH